MRLNDILIQAIILRMRYRDMSTEDACFDIMINNSMNAYRIDESSITFVDYDQSKTHIYRTFF